MAAGCFDAVPVQTPLLGAHLGDWHRLSGGVRPVYRRATADSTVPIRVSGGGWRGPDLLLVLVSSLPIVSRPTLNHRVSNELVLRPVPTLTEELSTLVRAASAPVKPTHMIPTTTTKLAEAALLPTTPHRTVALPKRFSGNPAAVLEVLAEGEEEAVSGASKQPILWLIAYVRSKGRTIASPQLDANGNEIPKPEAFTEAHWLAYTIQGEDERASSYCFSSVLHH